MSEDDQLVAPKEAAAMTTLSIGSITRLTQAGNFAKPIHITPRRLAYRKKDVLQWLRERELKGPVPQARGA